MFCSQCGAKIADSSIFCPNCGNKVAVVQAQSQIPAETAQEQPQAPQPQPIQQSVPQSQPVQPQPQQAQPQAQYVQPNPQPQYQQQGQQMQGQPQMQQQRPPMQGQPQMQQQRPPMQGQPQYQQQRPPMQGQPQMQQQRPPMQGQPQMQQQRPPMQGQPQMQQQRPPMPPQQQNPPKKKKKKGGIIVLIILLLLLLLALITAAVIFVISSGILKSPKKVFAEDVVKISENINDEIPSMGTIPLDALLHLGVDDTTSSHTSTRTTDIVSDQMVEYNVEWVQSYSYNKDNGDTAYDLTVNVNGSPMGTGAIYFADNEFFFVPMNTNSSMVRYQMDSATKEGLKDLGAMERFSLMVMERGRGSDVNWNQEISNFSNDTLGEISKKSFEKSKAPYKILGEEKNCKTVTVKVSDKEAFDIIEGFGDLMYKGIDTGDDTSAFDSLLSSYEENGGKMDLTMTTYRYKKTPVAISMEISIDGEVKNYEISCYKKGSEKQFIFDSGDSYYEESVVSKGIGQTHMTNKCDFGSAFFTLEQDSTGIGNNKELKGTFEIIPDADSDGDSMATVAGNTISGTVEETSILGNGVKTTVLESEKGSVSIVTTIERGALDASKITPPTFISESGVDCGTSLEDLKTILKVYTNEDAPKLDNSLIHMAQVYFLMVKKSGVVK